MTEEWVIPQVTEAINRLSYYWANYELLVEADRITDAGQAELWFYHCNSVGNALFHIAKANLLASPTMASLSKYLTTEHTENVPWRQVLTFITRTTLEYQRRGEPGVTLQPLNAKELKPAFFIEPLIIKNVPNVIFGEKGVNKTTLALTLLGLIQTEESTSPCALIPTSRAKIAMLDWEANQALTNYTLARLIEGQTIPYFELAYLRCHQTLADDTQRIANFLHDNRVEVVLIDSLGKAAGSEKFDNAGKNAALRFFEILGQLNITSLIIGQTAKGEEGKPTIYGSTYYTYYARNIFMLRSKLDELDDNRSHLALFHQESNYTKKHSPIGFLVSYTDISINITSEPVTLSEFLEKASQIKNLLDLLKSGAKSRQAICQELGKLPNQVDVILNRAKKRHLVINLGSGMWGLPANKDEP